jgi:hypothetical protein
VSLANFDGQTIRLRVAEVDNQNFFQVGIDDVAITSSNADEGDAVSRALGGRLLVRATGHASATYGQ